MDLTYEFAISPANLVAALYFGRDSPYDTVELMSVWLFQPITAATLFGCIALTPTYGRRVTAGSVSEQATENNGSAPSSGHSDGCTPNHLPLIELQRLRLENGAFLLREPAFAPSWTTSVRTVSVIFKADWDDDNHKQTVDTIFELLKLAGHQNDPDGLRKHDELSIESLDSYPGSYSRYQKYHIRPDISEESYKLFAARVSHSQTRRLVIC
jgi:hypothetical protein